MVFAGVALTHAALAIGQPVLAGRYFDGDIDAIGIHSLNGVMLIPLACMAQVVAAVLLWRPGRGPWWPVVVTLLLVLAEGFQIGMGFSRTLSIHLPLGAAIVATTVTMAAWSLSGRTRPRTERAAAP